MLLTDYVRWYASTHDLKPSSERQYHEHAKALMADVGHVAVQDLSVVMIAQHVRKMRLEGYRDSTRKSRRSHLLTLLRAASRDSSLAQRPVMPDARDVPPVRVRDYLPDGFTHEEASRLIAAASRMDGSYSNGISRAGWWRAWVPAAWDSGLLPCDLFLLRRRSIADDGQYYTVRVKTGTRVLVRFRQSTLDAMDAIGAHERTYVFPEFCTYENLRKQFRKLRTLAGLERGTLKWLRSGSGSDVEAQHPGAGHLHLANSRHIFEANYRITRITDTNRPRPRELSPDDDHRRTG